MSSRRGAHREPPPMQTYTSGPPAWMIVLFFILMALGCLALPLAVFIDRCSTPRWRGLW